MPALLMSSRCFVLWPPQAAHLRSCLTANHCGTLLNTDTQVNYCNYISDREQCNGWPLLPSALHLPALLHVITAPAAETASTFPSDCAWQAACPVLQQPQPQPHTVAGNNCMWLSSNY